MRRGLGGIEQQQKKGSQRQRWSKSYWTMLKPNHFSQMMLTSTSGEAGDKTKEQGLQVFIKKKIKMIEKVQWWLATMSLSWSHDCCINQWHCPPAQPFQWKLEGGKLTWVLSVERKQMLYNYIFLLPQKQPSFQLSSALTAWAGAGADGRSNGLKGIPDLERKVQKCNVKFYRHRKIYVVYLFKVNY